MGLREWLGRGAGPTFPDPPEGGMTYANWRFGLPGLSSVAVTAHLDNDPGPASHLYLQLYDAPIDATACYHGIQTIDLAIFSKFGALEADHVRPGAGAEVVVGTDEGPYVSVRLPFPVRPGPYRSELRRVEEEAGGDWFEYRVARLADGPPGGGEASRTVGAIWFPRARPGTPASIADGGGTWTECWDNNTGVLHPVPFWQVRLDPPVANGHAPAQGVSLRCSRMPNGVIDWDGERRQVVTRIGGALRRRGSGARTVRFA